MNKIIPILAFFAAAFLTAALVIPNYLLNKLTVVPTDLDITTVSTTKPGAQLLDKCSFKSAKVEVKDVELTQSRRSMIIAPTDAKQVTLRSSQAVRIVRIGDRSPSIAPEGSARDCEDGLLKASRDELSVNRKTVLPNNKISRLFIDPESVSAKPVTIEKRTGYQYKFGFDVKKKSYRFFDTTARRDYAVDYVDETKIHGVRVYHFVSTVAPFDLSELVDSNGGAILGTTIEKSASWWGIPNSPGIKQNTLVSLNLFYKNERHLYVEPATGVIVLGREIQEQYYAPGFPEEAPTAIKNFKVTALNATFEFNDATQKMQAKKASEYKSEINLGKVILPTILGILGTICGILALVFFLRRPAKHIEND